MLAGYMRPVPVNSKNWIIPAYFLDNNDLLFNLQLIHSHMYYPALSQKKGSRPLNFRNKKL